MTNLLTGCKAKISTDCSPDSVNANVTMMEECFEKAQAFNSSLAKCMDDAIKGGNACGCFQVKNNKAFINNNKYQDDALLAAQKELKPCNGK